MQLDSSFVLACSAFIATSVVATAYGQTFATSTLVVADTGQILDILPFDWSGDGDLDLTLALAGGTVLRLRNPGGATSWTGGIGIGGSNAMSELEYTSLGGPGTGRDLVIGYLFGAPLGWSASGTNNVLGPVQFVSAPTTFLAEIDVADVDGDGVEDVVCMTASPPTIGIVTGDGQGGFTPYVTLAQGTDLRGLETTLGASKGDLRLFDVDGDGNLDITIAGGTEGVLAMKGQGGGSFGPMELLSPVPIAHELFFADLDGVAPLDLVAWDVSGGSSIGSRVDWAAGLPGGGFAAPVQLDGVVGRGPTVVADIDGNGLSDIAYEKAGALWCVLSNGGGDFTAPQWLGECGDALKIETGDFDGDGDLDLVVSTEVPDPFLPFSQTFPLRIHWNDGVPQPSGGSGLVGTPRQVSVLAGGEQVLTLDAGGIGDFYVMCGTATGVLPGLDILDVGLNLPLNVDAYFNYLLGQLPNQPGGIAPMPGSTFGESGFLSGTHAVRVRVPPGSDPSFVGLTLHHAFVTFDFGPAGLGALVFVSNAVPLTLVP
jgi:hypothetical protein